MGAEADLQEPRAQATLRRVMHLEDSWQSQPGGECCRLERPDVVQLRRPPARFEDGPQAEIVSLQPRHGPEAPDGVFECDSVVLSQHWPLHLADAVGQPETQGVT